MVSLCPFCALLSLKKNSFYEQGKILNWVGELLSWKEVLENDSVRREGRADMGWEGDGTELNLTAKAVKFGVGVIC